jgi:proteic killer suppression protein
MEIEFDDDELRRLYEDGAYVHPRFGRDVVKAFRKKVGLIVAANDERDIRSVRSLHDEKLAGDRTGQHSMRLNDQWRLIVRLEAKASRRVVVIIEIVDYH